MSDLPHKIKSWYSKLTTKKASYDRPSIKPVHDWMVILTATNVVILLSALIAVYFYLEVDKGKLFVITNDTIYNETKVNTAMLKKVVDDIHERERALEEIRQGKAVPSNPSI